MSHNTNTLNTELIIGKQIVLDKYGNYLNPACAINNLIITVSDKIIKIWDSSRNFECIKQLSGHTAPIFTITTYNNYIISANGSCDNTIRIWDINSGNCIKTLDCNGGVLILCVYDNKLISGLYDKTIKIWDLASGVCVKTLLGNTEGSRSICCSDGKIINGSYDGPIKIWDIHSGNCSKTLIGHTDHVNSVYMHENKIVSCSRDKTVKIWNMDSGLCIKTINTHDCVGSICVKYNLIFGGLGDGTINIWDINSYTCIKTLKYNNYAVTAIFICDNILVTCFNSDDIVVSPIIKVNGELTKFNNYILRTKPSDTHLQSEIRH